MYLKILLSIFTLLVVSCAPIQRYESVVQNSYKRSKTYTSYNQKVEDDISYFKLRKNKEKLFFLIRNEKDVLELLLSIKYKGKNWMYMSKIEFIDLETDKSFLLDFYEHKLYRPIWKDRTTLGMKVEEYIAFPLKEKEIEEIISLISLKNIQIKLYSDFDERTFTRYLEETEKNNLIEVFLFYKELEEKIISEKENNERLRLEEEKLDENKQEFYESTNSKELENLQD